MILLKNTVLKYLKINKKNQQQLTNFCRSIYREMNWDWSFVDDLVSTVEEYKKGTFFIVKEGKQIIGCGGLKGLNTRKALIKRFYIANEYRGKGLAKKLLDLLEKEATIKNYKVLVLDVLKENLPAKKFYIKHDYKKYMAKSDELWPETNNPELFDYYRKNL